MVIVNEVGAVVRSVNPTVNVSVNNFVIALHPFFGTYVMDQVMVIGNIASYVVLVPELFYSVVTMPGVNVT